MRKACTLTVWFAALVLGLGLLPGTSPSAHAKNGYLFVSNSAFPTSASSIKDFIRIGRKKNQKKLRWSSSDGLRIQFLLVLRRRFGAKRLYLVLYQRGKKGYKDARDIPVKRKTKLLVSWLTFTGSYLKSGKSYELRAVKIRRRGKRKIETVVARVRFKLR